MYSDDTFVDPNLEDDLQELDPTGPVANYLYFSAQAVSPSGEQETIYLGSSPNSLGERVLAWVSSPQQWIAMPNIDQSHSLMLRDVGLFLTADGFSNQPQPLGVPNFDQGVSIVDAVTEFVLMPNLLFGPPGSEAQGFDLEICNDDCESRYQEERIINLRNSVERLETKLGQCCQQKNQKNQSKCVIL
jgi:hypothetical protein